MAIPAADIQVSARPLVQGEPSGSVFWQNAVSGILTGAIGTGGGGGTPSNTVSSGTSYGTASNAGSATTYSRGDHQHGTVSHEDISQVAASAFSTGQYPQWNGSQFLPSTLTIPSASSTVTSGTSYSLSPLAGSAGTFSRGDHQHGSPPHDDIGNLTGSAFLTGQYAQWNGGQFVGAAGTGGPGAATTVQAATSYAIASSVGIDTTYAREDHQHGSVPHDDIGNLTGTGFSTNQYPQWNGSKFVAASLSIPSPASSVTSGTSYGTSSAVGTSTLYARQDHQHGTVSHDDIGNLTGSGFSSGQFTTWNGTKFVGGHDDVGNLTASGFSTNQYAQWNGSKFVGGAGGGGPSPATTVQAATSYGISSAVGTLTSYAREDHQHGSVMHDDMGNLTGSAFTTGQYVQWNGSNFVGASGSSISPSSTVSSGTSYGTASSAGSASTYSRGDHQHGTVGHDDIGNLTGAGFVSGQYAQWNGSNFVSAAGTSSSYTPIAGNSGAKSYAFWFDGTNYNATNLNTGVKDYSGTNGATILQDILNVSTVSNPVWVKMSPEVSISGTVAVYGSSWSLIADHGGTATATTEKPFIQTLQLGVSGHTTVTIQSVYTNGLILGELDIFNYPPVVKECEFHSTSFKCTGAAGAQGIVIDLTKGSGYSDYMNWTGKTSFYNGNSTTSAGPYPGGVVHFLGNVSGTDQFAWDHMTINGGPTSGFQYVFHCYNGCYTGRVWVNSIDYNSNGSGYSAAFMQVDGDGGVASTTVASYFHINSLAWEQHQTTAYLLQLGAQTNGSSVEEVYLSIDSIYPSTNGIALINDQGAKQQTGNGHYLLEIHSITMSSPGIVTVGTMHEVTQAPIFIGRCYSAGAPLDTGSLIANPVYSGVLSVGGGSSFSAGVTYTIGGTPLLMYCTNNTSGATITQKTASGTTIINAQTIVVGDPYPMMPGQTVLVTGTLPSLLFVKAV
jgi:hypothetical protein